MTRKRGSDFARRALKIVAWGDLKEDPASAILAG
jgi:hypothetical protein